MATLRPSRLRGAGGPESTQPLVPSSPSTRPVNSMPKTSPILLIPSLQTNDEDADRSTQVGKSKPPKHVEDGWTSGDEIVDSRCLSPRSMQDRRGAEFDLESQRDDESTSRVSAIDTISHDGSQEGFEVAVANDPTETGRENYDDDVSEVREAPALVDSTTETASIETEQEDLEQGKSSEPSNRASKSRKRRGKKKHRKKRKSKKNQEDQHMEPVDDFSSVEAAPTDEEHSYMLPPAGSDVNSDTDSIVSNASGQTTGSESENSTKSSKEEEAAVRMSIWRDHDTLVLSERNPERSKAATAATAAADILNKDDHKSFDSAVDTVTSIISRGSTSRPTSESQTKKRRDEISFRQVRDAMRNFLYHQTEAKENGGYKEEQNGQTEEAAFWSKCAILTATAVMTTRSPNKVQLAQIAAEEVLANCPQVGAETDKGNWQATAAGRLKEVASDVSMAIMSARVEDPEASAVASAAVVILLNQKDSLTFDTKAVSETEAESEGEMGDAAKNLQTGEVEGTLAGNDDEKNKELIERSSKSPGDVVVKEKRTDEEIKETPVQAIAAASIAAAAITEGVDEINEKDEGETEISGQPAESIDNMVDGETKEAADPSLLEAETNDIDKKEEGAPNNASAFVSEEAFIQDTTKAPSPDTQAESNAKVSEETRLDASANIGGSSEKAAAEDSAGNPSPLAELTRSVAVHEEKCPEVDSNTNDEKEPNKASRNAPVEAFVSDIVIEPSPSTEAESIAALTKEGCPDADAPVKHDNEKTSSSVLEDDDDEAENNEKKKKIGFSIKKLFFKSDRSSKSSVKTVDKSKVAAKEETAEEGEESPSSIVAATTIAAVAVTAAVASADAKSNEDDDGTAEESPPHIEAEVSTTASKKEVLQVGGTNNYENEMSETLNNVPAEAADEDPLSHSKADSGIMALNEECSGVDADNDKETIKKPSDVPEEAAKVDTEEEPLSQAVAQSSALVIKEECPDVVATINNVKETNEVPSNVPEEAANEDKEDPLAHAQVESTMVLKEECTSNVNDTTNNDKETNETSRSVREPTINDTVEDPSPYDEAESRITASEKELLKVDGTTDGGNEVNEAPRDVPSEDVNEDIEEEPLAQAEVDSSTKALKEECSDVDATNDSDKQASKIPSDVPEEAVNEHSEGKSLTHTEAESGAAAETEVQASVVAINKPSTDISEEAASFDSSVEMDTLFTLVKLAGGLDHPEEAKEAIHPAIVKTEAEDKAGDKAIDDVETSTEIRAAIESGKTEDERCSDEKDLEQSAEDLIQEANAVKEKSEKLEWLAKLEKRKAERDQKASAAMLLSAKLSQTSVPEEITEHLEDSPSHSSSGEGKFEAPGNDHLKGERYMQSKGDSDAQCNGASLISSRIRALRNRALAVLSEDSNTPDPPDTTALQDEAEEGAKSDVRLHQVATIGDLDLRDKEVESMNELPTKEEKEPPHDTKVQPRTKASPKEPATIDKEVELLNIADAKEGKETLAPMGEVDVASKECAQETPRGTEQDSGEATCIKEVETKDDAASVEKDGSKDEEHPATNCNEVEPQNETCITTCDKVALPNEVYAKEDEEKEAPKDEDIELAEEEGADRKPDEEQNSSGAANAEEIASRKDTAANVTRLDSKDDATSPTINEEHSGVEEEGGELEVVHNSVCCLDELLYELQNMGRSEVEGKEKAFDETVESKRDLDEESEVPRPVTENTLDEKCEGDKALKEESKEPEPVADSSKIEIALDEKCEGVKSLNEEPEVPEPVTDSPENESEKREGDKALDEEPEAPKIEIVHNEKCEGDKALDEEHEVPEPATDSPENESALDERSEGNKALDEEPEAPEPATDSPENENALHEKIHGDRALDDKPAALEPVTDSPKIPKNDTKKKLKKGFSIKKLLLRKK